MEQVQTKCRYYNTIRDQFEGGNEVLFDLPIRVYYWYRDHTKGNSKISYNDAQKKLSRNVYLAWERKSRYNNPDRNRKYMNYGNLLLCLAINSFGNYEIVYIDNTTKVDIFDMDLDYRTYLNDRFNITKDNHKYDCNYIAALEEMVFVRE